MAAEAGAAPAGARPACVLLAEHEPEVAEMSARYLRRDGLGVRLVTAPEAALAELTTGADAVAVLDLTMPGLDPRRIRRALRTPAVFLAAGPRTPRPRGLAADRGAGRQWLGRPFSPRQLVALVREVLAPPPERPAAPAGQTAPAGAGLTAPAGAGLTEFAGAGLTATESAMLAALLDHRGRVLSRRRLLAAAGRDQAGDRAADVYIAQLRGKIGSGCAIRTVRGVGYVIDSLPSIRGGQ
jgi:DNA-binding response OmpR family regulator